MHPSVGDWIRRGRWWTRETGLLCELVPVVAGGTSAAFAQAHFRWRNDDGSQTTATWKAAEDTHITAVPLDTNLRLRFTIDETASGTFNNFQAQLRYSLNGGAYTAVSGSSSVVRASASSQFADEAVTTRQLTVATGTFLAGAMDENDGLAGSGNQIDFAAGQFTEVEYCVQIRSADVVSGNTVDLRVYNGVTALAAYTVTPRATIAVAASLGLGSVPITGQSVGVSFIGPSVGSLAILGLALTLSVGTGDSIALPAGALVHTGYAPTVSVVVPGAIAIPAGALIETGQSVGVSFTGPASGALSYQGYVLSLTGDAGTSISIPAGSLLLTGQYVGIAFIEPPAGSLVYTGQVLTVSLGSASGVTIALPQGTLTYSGVALTINRVIALPQGTLTTAGLALTVNRAITLPQGTLTYSGVALTVTIAPSNEIAIPKGTLTHTGYVLTISGGSVSIAIPKGTLTHTGLLLTVGGNHVVAIPAGTLRHTGRVLTIGAIAATYLEARSAIARSGVTYAGWTPPSVTLYLSGVDRTSTILQDSEFILTERHNEAATLTFSVRGLTITPVVGADVRLTYATPDDDLFGGTLLQVEATPSRTGSTALIYHCVAVGYRWLLDRYDLVLKRYHTRGVNAIAADVVATYQNGGFRIGYAPSSLGDFDATFSLIPVSEALTQMGTATTAMLEVTSHKIVNLAAMMPRASRTTLTQTAILVDSLTYRQDLTQVRTRDLVVGAGTTVNSVAAVGATSVDVQDTKPFAVGGGLALSGVNRITYTGLSIGAGVGTLTGVSGIVDDLQEGDSISLLVDTMDSAAVTALAAVLGGGLSGQATHVINVGEVSESEGVSRAATDLAAFGSAIPELSWTYRSVQRELRPGDIVPVSITDPFTVSGNFLIQTVTTTLWRILGGTHVDVFQAVTASRVTTPSLTTLLRKVG